MMNTRVRILCLTLILCFGCAGAACADGVDSSLTIIFGAPSAFDALAGAGMPDVTGDMTSFEIGDPGGPTLAEPTVVIDASGLGNTEITIPSAPTIKRAGVNPSNPAVPEPGTVALVGLGVFGVIALARRKRS